MKKHFNESYLKFLQEVRPTVNQKDAVRSRLIKSIKYKTPAIPRKSIFQWRGLVAAVLLFIICGGFLFMQFEPQSDSASGGAQNQHLFSWDVEDLIAEKGGDGWLLYWKDNPKEVGTAKVISEEERQKILSSTIMHYGKNFKYFPYKTSMNIEHVKMPEVSIRYHFFIQLTEDELIHFSFDYPKIEHASVFAAMSSLEIKGFESYTHAKQLYVTHGYGTMIFPVGLKPVSISTFKEVYEWEGVTQRLFNQYTHDILNENWELEFKNDNTRRFISIDGNEVITISLEGDEIQYDFYYPNREE